jgi:cell division inhibitor SepF
MIKRRKNTMAKLFNKMLNLVGWESEEEELQEKIEENREEAEKAQLFQTNFKKKQNKVLNIHSPAQFNVVIVQPENFDEAKDICDHLKSKKPVVVNLETIEKESAQRVVDFLSGSVYALDGHIQKVSNSIFVIAPNNIDIMSDFKEEFRNKGVFPWVK